MAAEKLGVRRIAEVLEVTPKTIYEWLRGKGPLHPDHVKSQLVRKLDEAKGHELGTDQPQTKITGRRLSFFPDAAADRLAKLPVRYRERYENRIREIEGRIERELSEYLKLLESEYQSSRGKRKMPES